MWMKEGFLSAEECKRRLAALQQQTWHPATVNSARGRVVKGRVRNNSVAVLRDLADADGLFERLRPSVPSVMHFENDSGTITACELAGLKCPLRVYRYQVGQHFGVHQDQSYLGENNTRSRLTFMVFLNDDFDGGGTAFPTLEQRVTPSAGLAVFFQHAILHEGEMVTRGTKYVLRSDVLYT